MEIDRLRAAHAVTGWPARCPGCDGAIVNVTYSTPARPIYACGSMGDERACRRMTEHELFAAYNVVALTDAESAELVALCGDAIAAHARSPRTYGPLVPVVGWVDTPDGRRRIT